MNQQFVKWASFRGVSTTPVTPEHITFSELVNFRNDRKMGGLTNRYGFKNYLSLDYQPDAICFNDFGDVSENESLLLLGDSAISIRGTLRSSYGSIDALDTTNIYDMTTATSKIYTRISSTVFQVGSTADMLYNIVIDSLTGEMAVIIELISATQFRVSKSVDWAAAGVVYCYQSSIPLDVLSLEYTLTGFPEFIPVDNNNNLLLAGVKEENTEGSLWIGRIGDKIGSSGDARRYFGSVGFEYNGIICEPLVEDFTIGAFRKSIHHIQVKTITALPETEDLAPASTSDYSGIWKDQLGNTVTTTIHTFLDDEPYDDADYVHVQDTGGSYPAFPYIQLALTTPTNPLNPALGVNIHWRVRAFGATGIISYNVHVYESRNGSDVLLASVPGLVPATGAFWPGVVYVPAVDIQDASNLSVKIVPTIGSASYDFGVSYVSMEAYVLADAQTKQAIDNTHINPTFGVNFALILDGFNRTRLIYDSVYGDSEDGNTSLQDSSVLSIGYDTTDRWIGARISTSLAEIINRRVTAIEVYAGPLIGTTYDWRLVETIDLDSESWRIDSTTKAYYCDIVIGNEVNIGPGWIDRYGRAPDYTAVKSVKAAVHSNERTFIVDAGNPSQIVYSPVTVAGAETTIFPLENLLRVNQTRGDITALAEVPDKLMVLKRLSTIAIPFSTFPDSVRPEVLSDEVGIATAGSLINFGRQIAFASHDGIYVTDGFKIQLANLDWVYTFRQYSSTIIETCIAFFDIFSDSIYFHFRNGTTTQYLWVYDIKTGDWHQEEFVYSDVNDYGFVMYAARRRDGRIVFADNLTRTTEDYMQLYLFPRDEYPAVFTNLINVDGTPTEISTKLILFSNPVDNSIGMAVGNYIDGGYLKSNVKVGDEVVYTGYDDTEATSVDINIYDGDTLIKAIPFELGREESTVWIRKSLTRFAIQAELYVRDEFTIKEFGIYFRQLLKSGAIKQAL